MNIPDKMKHLRLDRRGYPIPYIVLVEESSATSEGVPHFVINDHARVISCARYHLCGICGTPLTGDDWFVGGIRNAFLRKGAYNDPPMHDECGHYALQVCPFLAMPSYKGANLEAAMGRVQNEERMIVDRTVTPGKPRVFVALMAKQQRPVIQQARVLFRPRHPYKKLEYWRDGQQVPWAEAKRIRDDVLAGRLSPTA